MATRTRPNGADATPKIYYSRRVPQQVYFPHRHKKVRRRTTPVAAEHQKQMVFLPEKMRLKRMQIIQDSDEDSEADKMQEGSATDMCRQTTAPKNRKRNRNLVEEETGAEISSEDPATKYQRKGTAGKQKRQIQSTAIVCKNDKGALSEIAQDKKTQRRRRQSTMTQLIDARPSLSDTEEPTFKPVKRSSRSCRDGKHKDGGKMIGKSKQQRTLTQMVPGIQSSELDLEDHIKEVEQEEQGSHQYDEAVAQRLIRQGLHHMESGGVGRAVSSGQMEKEVHFSHANKDDMDGQAASSEDSDTTHEYLRHSIKEAHETIEEEDSYRPTQYIDAPATRSNGNLPWRNARSKAKFREPRIPLKECYGNLHKTPEISSGRKRVEIQESKSKSLPPPALKRFQSTIRDSEDDDEDTSDSDLSLHEHQNRVNISIWTPAKNKHLRGTVIGANTQVIVDQIDRACANAEEDAAWLNQDGLKEFDGSIAFSASTALKTEVEENQRESDHSRTRQSSEDRLHSLKQNTVEGEDSYDATANLPIIRATSSREEQSGHGNLNDNVSQSQLSRLRRSTSSLPQEACSQETFPSTPMVIQDDSSCEEADPADTAPHGATKAAVKAIVEPATTSAQHDENSNMGPIQSPVSRVQFGAKQQPGAIEAEQQCKAGWPSRSRRPRNRHLQQSSMNVEHDTLNYHAVSWNAHPIIQSPPPPSRSNLLSQATTINEMTPKKIRVRDATIDTHKAPDGDASLQLSSPSSIEPPPLLIPSSFPSLGEVGMERWNSSPFSKAHDGNNDYFGSLENMSIPPPPPIWDD